MMLIVLIANQEIGVPGNYANREIGVPDQ